MPRSSLLAASFVFLVFGGMDDLHGRHPHASSRGNQGQPHLFGFQLGGPPVQKVPVNGHYEYRSVPHYGYGYVYDPYHRGSFQMQDPLKDPFFQAEHKFDSQFPGRYTPQQRLRFRQQYQR